jgi:hypothetical protein
MPVSFDVIVDPVQRRCGEVNRKGRSPALSLAMGMHRTTVKLDQVMHQCQPDAETAMPA